MSFFVDEEVLVAAMDRQTAAIDRQTVVLGKMLFRLADATAEVSRAASALCAINMRLYRPERPKLLQKGIDEMMNLIFDITLPPPGASDVKIRELTYKIGADDEIIESLNGVATAMTGLKGPEGALVEAVLVDIDGAGNRSEPSPKLSAPLADTIAPPAPGELGITVTGQEEI